MPRPICMLASSLPIASTLGLTIAAAAHDASLVIQQTSG